MPGADDGGNGDASVAGAATASLSSSAAVNYTVFAFERRGDMFYDQHSVRQLEDGRVLLLDVGNDRPGCVSDFDYKGCFSRAVLYSLDWEAKKAHVDWQFEAPYMLDAVDSAEWDPAIAHEVAHWTAMTHDYFNFDGGSVERLETGLIQVAFTSEMPVRAANANYSMNVWEVDEHARVRSMLTIPHASNSEKSEGGYRSIPLRTLQGETADMPDAFKHVRAIGG